MPANWPPPLRKLRPDGVQVANERLLDDIVGLGGIPADPGGSLLHNLQAEMFLLSLAGDLVKAGAIIFDG